MRITKWKQPTLSEVIQNELYQIISCDDNILEKFQGLVREYRQGIFVVYNLTKKDIDIKISKTIKTEKILSNLIKIKRKKG